MCGFLLGILAWIAVFKIDKGSSLPFSRRGGGSKTQVIQPAPQPDPPSVGDTAANVYQARLKYDPQVQQMEFENLQKYLPQYTQQYYDVRQDVFGKEAQVADALRQQTLAGLQDPSGQMANTLGLAQQLQTGLEGLNPEQTALQNALQQQIMGQLTSPTGLTGEQSAAQEAIRAREVARLQEGMRTRANLGGGLFGGRAAGAEERAVSEMGQAFAAEDIDRQERSRMAALANAMQMSGMNMANLQGMYGAAGAQQQNAMQAAYPYLQMLYPEVGMVTPQFTSAVPGANQAMSSAANIFGTQSSMYNALVNAQAQQNVAATQARAQMVGSLFKGLGSAAGAYYGAQ